MNILFATFLFAAVSTAFGTCPCGDNKTCCDGPSLGLYGCCTDPDAVCCSDGLHWCPQNTVCNLDKGTCDEKSINALQHLIIMSEPDPLVKAPAQAAVLEETNEIGIDYCPGRQYYCQDGQTCCRMPSGRYSCCPYPSASCCADGLHCCQYGTHCDPTSRYCLREKNSTALRQLIIMKKPDPPAIKSQAAVLEEANEIGNQYCPGGQYYCQDGQTCCHMPTGQYSCCPYPSASCCADGMHCCQSGTHCDPTSRYCLREKNSTALRQLIIMKKPDPPAVKSQAAVLEEANEIGNHYCPGRQYYCQDGQTCCRMPSGHYSCCPYQSASCCPDGIHCCQYGTHCDHTSRYCLRGNSGYQTLLMEPAFPMK